MSNNAEKRIKTLTHQQIKEGEHRGIAFVVERNQSASGVPVRFYLDGEVLGDLVPTDDEGMARIEFQTKKEGTAYLEAKVSGEAAIKRISFTATKPAEKEVQDIDWTSARTGDIVEYTIWAIDEKKKPIPYQKFEVTDRGTGQKYSLTGDKDGKAVYSCDYYSSLATRMIIFTAGKKERTTGIYGGGK